MREHLKSIRGFVWVCVHVHVCASCSLSTLELVVYFVLRHNNKPILWYSFSGTEMRWSQCKNCKKETKSAQAQAQAQAEMVDGQIWGHNTSIQPLLYLMHSHDTGESIEYIHVLCKTGLSSVNDLCVCDFNFSYGLVCVLNFACSWSLNFAIASHVCRK